MCRSSALKGMEIRAIEDGRATDEADFGADVVEAVTVVGKG